SKPAAAGVPRPDSAAGGEEVSVMGVRAGCRLRWRAAGAGSVAVAAQQVAVGVDAAVAEEGPDATHVLAAAEVDLAGEDGGVAAGLGDELALRPQHVAVAPEVDARRADRRGFVADA